MAKEEKKAAGGLFDRLFFKQDETSDSTGTNPVDAAPAEQGAGALPKPSDSESEVFVEKFREVIKSTNETGAKFIQLLYRLASEPKGPDYEKAFDMLKIMDSTLTVSNIVSSMQKLIGMVGDETSRYIQEGNNKKAALQSAFEEESRSLNERVATITAEIATLEESLRQKRAARDASERELQGLNGKHMPKIESVQRTIANLQTAYDKTRSSLEQTLNEINNYLK